MATPTRPVPPHGSEGRYRGTPSGSRPPCRCDACTRGNRLAGIRRARARAAGIGNLVDCAALIPHLDQLVASGMSQQTIARQSGVSATTISYIRNGKIRSCQRPKAARLLAVKEGTFDIIAEQPMLPVQRKLQALYALGHGQLAIAAAGGLNHSTVSQIVNGRYQKLDGTTVAKAEAAYRDLSTIQGGSWKARARARQGGWAPPAAWDEEAFADPDAHPDWTGRCGTDQGYWMHRTQQLPMCPRCEQAHKGWLDEHASIGGVKRNQMMFAARAAASTRGADIAADARELMRLGCDYEQAAARIGVTRQHLQQELQRHPVIDTELAA